MEPQPPGYPAPPPPPPSYGGPPVLPGTFSFGDILGQTFSTYAANFLAFVSITALVSLPAILATLIVGSNPLGAFIPGLIGLVTGPIGTGAITYGVYEYLLGRQTTVGDCLRVGFANVVPVLGVAILSGLIIVAGIILCFVPGLIAMTVLAVAVPVAIQEREKRDILVALRRSAALTEGYRWDVFGVLFVIGAINLGVGIVVGVLFGMTGHIEQARLIAQVIGILVGGLGATAPAVMYYRLRSVKESVDVRDIASVFD
jgi:hypothetical protein